MAENERGGQPALKTRRNNMPNEYEGSSVSARSIALRASSLSPFSYASEAKRHATGAM